MSAEWAKSPLPPKPVVEPPEPTLEETILSGDLSTTTIRAYIRSQALKIGVYEVLAEEVAKAESGFVWNATTTLSSASGIYQWISSSWDSICHPLGFQDVFNPVENINCALVTIKNGGISHWSASQKMWETKITP